MTTRFSRQEGHAYAPGHEPTPLDRTIEGFAALEPYTGFLVSVSCFLLFLVVARWALRKIRSRAAKTRAAKPTTLSPLQEKRRAERAAALAAFEARQVAAEAAMRETRARAETRVA